MQTILERELAELKLRLIRMCRMVEEMIGDATEAVVTGDRELARRVAGADPAVDEAEMDIEKACMRLLWKQQPLAKDFRELSTILKLITDVERIGDQAADIANLAAEIKNFDFLITHTRLSEMGSLTVDMVAGGVKSYLSEDVRLAAQVVAADDRVDELFAELKREVVRLVREDAGEADDAVLLLMIAKYYERIGDHAVNICEWTDFNSSGVHKKY